MERNEAPPPADILVVDDDPSITSLLKRGLTYEGHHVRTADDALSALAAARDEPPDLVVLDVMLPGMDGLEACRRLRRADPTLPILLLTARDDPMDEIHGLDSGADDYVTKPFAFEVLNARVRALLRRRAERGQPSLAYADLRLDVDGYVAHRGERRIGLTATEFDVLLLLLSHAGQVLTKEQILEDVWGYDFGGNTNIVEVYVRSLRVKLEAGDEPRLIQTVRGVGYVLRSE